MANNVYCTLQLNYGSPQAEEEWKRVFRLLTKLDPYSNDYGLQYLDIYKTNAEIADNEFMMEHIGSTSALLEGPVTFIACSEYNYIYEHIIKAKWTPPIKFFEELADHLYDFDEDVKLSLVYEDEYYNFAGAITFAEGQFDQQQESGGWFTQEQHDQGRDPRDFQDFVTEQIEEFRREQLET